MNLMGVAGSEGSTGTLEDALNMDAAEINMTPEQRARREQTQTAAEMGGTTEEIAAENARARAGRAMSGEEPVRGSATPSTTAVEATVAAVERSQNRRAMARGLASQEASTAAPRAISASTARRLTGQTNNNSISININADGLDAHEVARVAGVEVRRALDEANRDALEDQEGLAS